MLIVSVNQDRGVKPGAAKGAAVHLTSMRRAFEAAGAQVLAVDSPDPVEVERTLAAAHSSGPIGLIYERYALGCGTAGRFAKTHDVPHILEVNAPLLEEAAAHRGRERGDEDEATERAILCSPGTLMVVSQPLAEWLVELGVPAERILVRPNGVDTELFRPRRLTPASDTRFVLGFHGRLRPWHGFSTLVDVFGRLLDRGHPVHLELIGQGDFAAELEGRVPDQSWSHEGWVPHDEVGRHVARFDVMALTYPKDAPCYFSPLKLLEAMACGVVPVVPALGDLESVVRHGENGLVYPAGDVDQLTESIEQLIAEKPLRRALSIAAVETAQSRSWLALAREATTLAARSPREAPP